MLSQAPGGSTVAFPNKEVLGSIMRSLENPEKRKTGLAMRYRGKSGEHLLSIAYLITQKKSQPAH